jgi:hypothetical protein
VTACGKLPELGWNVFAIPGQNSCTARHSAIVQPSCAF